MIRRPPRSTRTYTLFPYPTLFRSGSPGRRCRSGAQFVSAIFQNWFAISYRVPAGQPAWVDGKDNLADLDRSSDDFGFLRRSEEHTSELQSLMRISYAVFCLKKKNRKTILVTMLHSFISVNND